MHEVDVICPIYWVDWDFFTSNVQSWVNELPVNKLIFSYNNPDESLYQQLSNYLPLKFGNDKVLFLDHREYKTLGKCLIEMMKRVETEWFAYVHADAQLTPFCFNIMNNLMNGKTGIIESERLHYDGVKYTYDPYYFHPRSYSGFQIIKKEAIKEGIELIEDDYLYRNEDMIFQNICETAGFEYVKTLAMHIHQITTTKKWTFERFDTYDMQWKGLIKYTTPTEITVQACVDALGVCVREFKFDPAEALDIMSQEWKTAVIQKMFKFHC